MNEYNMSASGRPARTDVAAAAPVEAPQSRKRARDRLNQAAKRRREKDYIGSLEARIGSLEAELKSRRSSQALPSSSLTVPGQGAVMMPAEQARKLQTCAHTLDEILRSLQAIPDPTRQQVFIHQDHQVGDSDTSGLHPSTSAGDEMPLDRDEGVYKHSVYLPAASPSSYSSPTAGSTSVASPAAIEHLTSIDVSPHAQPGDGSNNHSQIYHISAPAANVPRWSQLPAWGPAREPMFSELARLVCCRDPLEYLQATPAAAAALPDEPEVMDLMFGGSPTNFLANALVSRMRSSLVQTTERLALLWLLYLLLHWTAAPSERTFAQLPPFLAPTPLQRAEPHPRIIDLALWPRLRDNAIRHQGKLEVQAWGALYGCTVRVRDSWKSFSEEVVQRGDASSQGGGMPKLHPAFRRKMHDLASWGIMERFWNEYPELVEGLDPGIMIRDEELMLW